MEIDSKDYHDFVIKDKKLIGEFDQMYQKSEDIPWHQDQIESWIDVRLAVQMLKQDVPFDVIVDVTCGLGYFLDVLKRQVGSCRCCSLGFDLSITACKKASVLFSDSTFYNKDLTKNGPVLAVIDNSKYLYAIRGSLFYMIKDINNVVDNLYDSIPSGGFLLVSQGFPPLNNDFLGKDILPEPLSVERLFLKRFSVLRSLCFNENDNNIWYIGIFKKEV